MSNIFCKRVPFKPFEYDVEPFKHAINHSYWLVSEWNFTADIQDFHTKLTPEQQSVIKNALLAISQIEVSVKRFWGSLGLRFPKAEFDQVGLTFAESEVRHSDAYSHLLQILGLNDDFAMLLQVPAIQGRVDYLTKYLRGASANSDEHYSLTLALFSLFVENVSLFSQFAVVKAFNKHLNILKDIDNVVQATQQEECHAVGTEILTPSGWVDLECININDSVYQYNHGMIEETKVQHKTSRSYSGDMIRFHNNTTDCLVTPGHEMVYFNPAGDLFKRQAKDFIPHSKMLIPKSAILLGGEVHSLSALDKLKIAIQADGTKLSWRNLNGDLLPRGKNSGYNYSISLTKTRKIERLRTILAESKISFTELRKEEKEVCFKLKMDSEANYKEFDWINLSDKSSAWCKEFVAETTQWDGFNQQTSTGYSSTNKKAISVVQAIAVLAGYETNIPYSRQDPRSLKYKICKKVIFKKRNRNVASHGFKKEVVPYSGMVNCVTVPSGIIITRYNGKVTIAGNCIHAMLGAKILNYVKEENPEWFTQDFYDKIDRACKKAYTAECNIIDWIFESGDLDFISRDSLKEFIKRRFNQSVAMIGGKDVFEIDAEKIAPLKWFEEELIAEVHNDFFNKRSVTYAKKTKSITAEDLF